MSGSQAHLRVAATIGFVVIVVLTPREWVWAFVGYAVVLCAVAVALRVPLASLGRRMLIEVPFLVFALLMPLLGRAPYVTVGPLELSEPGLWSAWNLAAKGTLGVVAALLLAAQHEPVELVDGLRRLKVPALLTEIGGFFVRYLDVVQAEAHRMSVARAARGFEASSPRSWPALAHGVGTLFVRSYERGERVHLAMLSRGYDGSVPDLSAVASISGGRGAAEGSAAVGADGAAAGVRRVWPGLLPLAALVVLASGWALQAVW